MAQWPAEADEPLRRTARLVSARMKRRCRDRRCGMITFERLERVSFFHSLVYLSLLIVAFGLGNPQP